MPGEASLIPELASHDADNASHSEFQDPHALNDVLSVLSSVVSKSFGEEFLGALNDEGQSTTQSETIGAQLVTEEVASLRCPLRNTHSMMARS
ncbi:hypothetical protein V6N13_125612 [Hibiscus sabdariffa]